MNCAHHVNICKLSAVEVDIKLMTCKCDVSGCYHNFFLFYLINFLGDGCYHIFGYLVFAYPHLLNHLYCHLFVNFFKQTRLCWALLKFGKGLNSTHFEVYCWFFKSCCVHYSSTLYIIRLEAVKMENASITSSSSFFGRAV